MSAVDNKCDRDFSDTKETAFSAGPSFYIYKIVKPLKTTKDLQKKTISNINELGFFLAFFNNCRRCLHLASPVCGSFLVAATVFTTDKLTKLQ